MSTVPGILQPQGFSKGLGTFLFQISIMSIFLSKLNIQINFKELALLEKINLVIKCISAIDHPFEFCS